MTHRRLQDNLSKHETSVDPEKPDSQSQQSQPGIAGTHAASNMLGQPRLIAQLPGGNDGCIRLSLRDLRFVDMDGKEPKRGAS